MMLQLISLAFSVFHDEALSYHCICSSMLSPSHWTAHCAMLFLVFIPLFPDENSISACYPSSSWKLSLAAQEHHLFVLLIPMSFHVYFSVHIYFHLYVVLHDCCPYPRFPWAVKLLKFPSVFIYVHIFFFFLVFDFFFFKKLGIVDT